jgi:mono/diheme cytochrome c family protein
MKAWMVVVGIAAGVQATAMAARLPVAAQSSPQQSQIEKGRVAVTQVCVGCHGAGGGIMRMLEVRTRSEQEWRETIYRMILRGAQVFPDEIEPMTAYLVASAGRGRPQAASPAGSADAVLARRCQQCHDLEKATAKPASEDWTTVLERMIKLGATVTPAEQQTLIAYLNGLEK